MGNTVCPGPIKSNKIYLESSQLLKLPRHFFLISLNQWCSDCMVNATRTKNCLIHVV